MGWLIFGVLGFLGLILFLFRKHLGAFFRFLVSKLFLINLVLALALAFTLPYCSLNELNDYTNHGIKKEVPYLIGTHIDDLESKMSGTELVYKIIDSTFNDEYASGTIIKQDPDPKLNYDSVKPGRTIYLTIVKEGGEYKEVPDLTGNSVTSKEVAKIKLESRGFKVAFVSKPSKDANVIDLQMDGKSIKPGTKLLKGSKITIVHGSGSGGTAVTLPNIKGLSVLEANHLLASANLILEVNYEPAALNEADSSNFVITSQNPTPASVPQGIVASGSTVSVIAKKGEPTPEPAP
jgi:beta-lactam-binding protein with PASTA domain